MSKLTIVKFGKNVIKINDEFISNIRSFTHVDGTRKLQTVSQDYIIMKNYTVKKYLYQVFAMAMKYN